MAATTPDDVDRRFSYHPPTRPGVADLHTHVRERCASLAHELARVLPASREAMLALTYLEETLMWANASIARHCNTSDDPLPNLLENAVHRPDGAEW